MGMSASQMRYCMISGKKSDVEFQGQQINQQRTTLSTESSTLNSQLLDMSVPTPPSTSDYTKTSYSFALDGNTCNISGSKYDSSSGTYTINYTYATTGDAAKTGQSRYYKTTNATTGAAIYTTGSSDTTATTLSAVSGLKTTDTNYNTVNSNLAAIYGDDYATQKDSSGNKMQYYYSTTNGTNRYVTSEQLAAVGTDSSKALTYSYVQEDSSINKSDTLKNANVTWSSTGRMDTISATDENGSAVTYTLTTNTTTDDTSYQDAYNEYQYQKAEYDQNLNKINAQICIVQSQDKKLELKLQDLDTQQQALSTEMDSVKKVIDKNIESSFKAFSA